MRKLRKYHEQSAMARNRLVIGAAIPAPLGTLEPVVQKISEDLYNVGSRPDMQQPRRTWCFGHDQGVRK
jgi:hypothetical protein